MRLTNWDQEIGICNAASNNVNMKKIHFQVVHSTLFKVLKFQQNTFDFFIVIDVVIRL